LYKSLLVMSTGLNLFSPSARTLHLDKMSCYKFESFQSGMGVLASRQLSVRMRISLQKLTTPAFMRIASIIYSVPIAASLSPVSLSPLSLILVAVEKSSGCPSGARLSA
jgi:hypothetical protein